MVTEAMLEGRIRKIQERLAELGPMRPGNLSRQYTVCGTPGCRCKDPDHPRKHGPYFHLKYPWKGRNTTEFVKPQDVVEVGKQLANYKRFRALTSEWVEISVELARLRKKRGSDEV
jgi:hypothetical protein